jgi:hypothetical protein
MCNSKSVASIAIGSIIAITLQSTAEAVIRRVNRNAVTSCGASCDGSNWTSRVYKYLQDAIFDSDPGDEIWVARGVYKPTEQVCSGTSPCPGGTCSSGVCIFTLPREKTFLLNGITIRGGFEGDETSVSQRPDGLCVPLGGCTGWCLQGDSCENVVSDCEVDEYCDFSRGGGIETILSGDVGSGNADSYHVVTYSAEVENTSPMLERVTVSGGNANDTSPEDGGSAVHIQATGTGPELVNCVFSGNSSSVHGAVNANASTASIQECAFLENQSTDAEGSEGGALQIQDGAVDVSTSAFWNNTAEHGGAVWATGEAAPVFSDCRFIDNTATTQGGAMWTTGNALVIEACVFLNNHANGDPAWIEIEGEECQDQSLQHDPGAGGALFVKDAESLSITESVFSGNDATNEGGAIWIDNTPEVMITGYADSTIEFECNSALDGGAIWIDGLGMDADVNFTVTSCTFEANAAQFVQCTQKCLLPDEGGVVELDPIACHEEDGVVIGCSVSCQGASAGRGGAIYASHMVSQAGDCDTDSGGCAVVISECLFENNDATKESGAVWIVDANPVVVQESKFLGNTLSGEPITEVDDPCIGIGLVDSCPDSNPVGAAALWANTVDLSCSNPFCEGTQPSIVGGAIRISGCEFRGGKSCAGSGSLWTINNDVLLEDTIVRENFGDQGFYLNHGMGHGDRTTTIRNVLVSDNHTWLTAGGMGTGSSYLSVQNLTVANNMCHAGLAGGMVLRRGIPFHGGEITDSIFWGNTGVTSTPEYCSANASYESQIHDQQAVLPGGLGLTYSAVQDGEHFQWSGVLLCDPESCVFDDPEFDYPGEYFLDQDESPCVDTGSCCLGSSCSVDPCDSPHLDDPGTTDDASSVDVDELDMGYHYPLP